MTQNIYDTPAFLEGYSRLPRSVGGLASAPEWPVLRGMLPDVRGLKIVDLGCGFGWFCRWAAEQDAAEIVGVDASEKMLARARDSNAAPSIKYRQADFDGIDLPAAHYDLAFSSLAFHYIDDMALLFARIHAALKPEGRLVFSTEHPIFMASRQATWLEHRDGGITWPVDSYLAEGARTTDWLAPGVVKYHRSLGTTLNALISTGFTVSRVEEFGPTSAQIADNPDLAKERERPMFLLVSAQRG